MHWTESYFEHAYLKRWALGPPSETTFAEAAHLLSLLRPPPDVPIVDVGCGHGRYAVALASLGRRVIGLDASRALLELAGRQAAGAAAPRWVRGDMRRLPFASRLGGAVLLDSFGFFDDEDDNTLVLRELRGVLPVGRRLVVAVVNAAPILAQFRPRDVERRGAAEIHIDRTLRREPLRLVERLSIHEESAVADYERRQRLYRREELAALLQTTGFAVRAVLGDYAGGAFDDAKSAKLVVLAEAAP